MSLCLPVTAQQSRLALSLQTRLRLQRSGLQASEKSVAFQGLLSGRVHNRASERRSLTVKIDRPMQTSDSGESR